MKARIDKKDLAHLEAFPAAQKSKILKKIHSTKPIGRAVLDGGNDFEKALLELRKKGYRLIDVQRQETSFASVWYRKTKSFFSTASVDVTMLLWELHDRGVETTILSWRI